MEILFWFSSFILSSSFLMKVYLSHLDVASAHGFILQVNYYFLSYYFFFFFLRKSCWFVLTKMEILFWFSLSILSFFFFLMKLELFNLDVASLDWLILHVDYYFLSCFFFFFWLRKSCQFVLICHMQSCHMQSC